MFHLECRPNQPNELSKRPKGLTKDWTEQLPSRLGLLDTLTNALALTAHT